MDTRIEMIKAMFTEKYGARTEFIESSVTTELIRKLLEGDRLEKILAFCRWGEAPLKAVVYDVEKFAEENALVKNGELPDEWKQNVGRIIGAIAHLYGYMSNTKENLDKKPKYFKNASKFCKE